MEGHSNRARGSPKKTFKKANIECTEDEIHEQWTAFKQKLDEYFAKDFKGDFYSEDDPEYITDIYLAPYLKNIENMLLDEDA